MHSSAAPLDAAGSISFYAAGDALFASSSTLGDLLLLLILLLLLLESVQLAAAPGAPGRMQPLLHRPKRALLGLVARLKETLNGLLAERMLLAADNATRLGLHQIPLLQAAARTLRRSVIDLRLGADVEFCHGSIDPFDFFIRI